MSAFISANGRLGGTPEIRITPSGKQVCNASLAVTDGSAGDDTLWLRLTGWERQGEALARYRKGDSLAVVGKLTLNVWTTASGEERKDLAVTVEQIVGARPKPRAKRKDSGDDSSHRASHRMQSPDEPFSDELAF